MTGLNRIQFVVKKVPILSPALKWVRNTVRSTWGPGWLKRQVEKQSAARRTNPHYPRGGRRAGGL